ncbi:putative ribonuclease H-like domain-containing protein [Tanacetum coccineum]
MAILKEHMRRFHGMDDAKEIWEAIRIRFGGNANSKKTQKAIFKQQFEAFTISSSEGLEKGYDRFQQLFSQLEAHGAEVSNEDANYKFLRSLPPAWSNLAMTMRTKPDVDTLSIDDLECTAKGTHDGKKKRDSFYQHQEAGKQEKNQMGLLTIDDWIITWGEHTELRDKYAIMVISSSDQEAQILAYSQAVKKLEAQLVTFQKQQLSLNEKLTFQANEIYEKDEKLKRYRRIGMKAVKEKEQLQKMLDSWKDSSKNLWRLINSGMSSNNKLGLGYEIQSNNEVLSYEEEMNFSVFNCSKEDSVGKPLDLKSLKPKISSVPPEVYVSTPVTTNEKGVSDPKTKEIEPSCVSHIKTPRQPIKDQATPKVNRKNWNAMMERELGEVWTNANRVNHANQFVPRSVQVIWPRVNTGSSNINTIRSRQPVPTKTSNNFSPKRPQGKIWDWLIRPQQVIIGGTQTPIVTSGPTFIRTVITKGPQGRPKPEKAWIQWGSVTDFEEFNGGSVTFGGSKGYITGKGKIRVGNLDFDSVSFVKELGHFNLFSISQICDKQHKVLFTETECLVVSSDFKRPDENQILLKVHRHHNMYRFDMKTPSLTKYYAYLIAKAICDESKLWHGRLGHINFKNLNKLVQGNLVRGLPSKVFKNDHTCVACHKGKQHRASCKAKLERLITEPLHTLHMDLFGPTSVKSINHASYCLVITDDCTRFSWVFFLASKDETSGILQNFIRQIENQLSHRVKIIRSDNGTEFKNRDMLEFCGNKGIKQEYSNARTPQQNGVAERMNRTLIEAARTMLADSLLPTTFWAEAVSTACYIFNRVRVTKPQNKTPYELLFGHKPIISYIRPFGCHVTILDTLSVLGKFDGKSDEGFLVGYSLNSKAYRVYNLVTKRVEVNLHVNFLEDKPNVKGVGYRWMFDIDYLTDSMNYIPVSLENQANPHTGASEVTNSAGTSQTLSFNAFEEKGKVSENTSTSTPSVNTGSEPVNNGSFDLDDSPMPELEIFHKSETGIFDETSYDEEGVITDFNSLPTEIEVSPTPTLRILFKIHNIHKPNSKSSMIACYFFRLDTFIARIALDIADVRQCAKLKVWKRSSSNHKLLMGSAIVKIGQEVIDAEETTVNASGEEQVEDISPTTLEAAKTLSRVHTSAKPNTDSINKSIPSPDKGQREGKAHMIIEEAPKKTKEQIPTGGASLAEAIRLDTLEKKEELNKYTWYSL